MNQIASVIINTRRVQFLRLTVYIAMTQLDLWRDLYLLYISTDWQTIRTTGGGKGGAENDEHHNDGQSKSQGMKLQDMKMQDMTNIS